MVTTRAVAAQYLKHAGARRTATRLGNYSSMKRSATTRTQTPSSSVPRTSIPPRQTDKKTGSSGRE
jgi:hypothetical protein